MPSVPQLKILTNAVRKVYAMLEVININSVHSNILVVKKINV